MPAVIGPLRRRSQRRAAEVVAGMVALSVAAIAVLVIGASQHVTRFY
jgi:hypothetical protein